MPTWGLVLIAVMLFSLNISMLPRSPRQPQERTKMTQSDMIHLLDKQNMANPTPCPHEGTPVKCQNGNNYSEHGALQVHKTGANLVCGRCGYNTPLSRIN